MIAIFCLDDHNGMVFNHRRQSKDKVLLADIMELCNGHMIYMSEYSNIMFRQYKKMVENIKVAPDFLESVK